MADIWPILSAAFSVAAAAFSALIGFVAKGMVGALQDLKRSDDQIRASLGEINLLVAGKYITREESQNARFILRQELVAEHDDLELRVREVENQLAAIVGGRRSTNERGP